jgi:hypothetical protein
MRNVLVVHRRLPLDDKREQRYAVVGPARADEPKSWNNCQSFEAVRTRLCETSTDWPTHCTESGSEDTTDLPPLIRHA